MGYHNCIFGYTQPGDITHQRVHLMVLTPVMPSITLITVLGAVQRFPHRGDQRIMDQVVWAVNLRVHVIE